MLKRIPPSEAKPPKPFPDDYPMYGCDVCGVYVHLLPFHIPAYDTEFWAPSSEIVTFFQRSMSQPYALPGYKRAKDLADTNMVLSGHFPNPINFEMKAISIGMSGVESDVEAVRANGNLRIALSGNRLLTQIPLSFVPYRPCGDLNHPDVREKMYSPEAHQFMQSQMAEMREKARGWQLSVSESGIIISPNYPFNVSILAPSGLVKDYVKIQVILDGIQYLPW